MSNPSDKRKRSCSLTEKLNDDLEELCEHLGVNVHSYMVNEIAKAVQRDRLTFLAKSGIDELLSDFKKLTESKSV